MGGTQEATEYGLLGNHYELTNWRWLDWKVNVEWVIVLIFFFDVDDNEP
jgi:hypothetical protein